MSLRLMCEMHALLWEVVHGENSTTGAFRCTQNWIGPAGCTLIDAVYVPPSVDEMRVALAFLERNLHAASRLPFLIRQPLLSLSVFVKKHRDDYERLLLQLVDDLFNAPVLTSPRAVYRLDITPCSAQLNIDKLVCAGILREVRGRKRNQVFLAADSVRIIEEEER